MAKVRSSDVVSGLLDSGDAFGASHGDSISDHNKPKMKRLNKKERDEYVPPKVTAPMTSSVTTSGTQTIIRFTKKTAPVPTPTGTATVEKITTAIAAETKQIGNSPEARIASGTVKLGSDDLKTQIKSQPPSTPRTPTPPGGGSGGGSGRTPRTPRSGATVGIECNLGKFKEKIEAKFRYLQNLQRSIIGSLSRFNDSDLLKMVQEAVQQRMKDRGVRYGATRSQSIIKNFTVTTTSTKNGNTTTKNIKIGHKFYDKKEYFYHTSKGGRKYRVLKSVVLNTMDSGRGAYNIGNPNNPSIVGGTSKYAGFMVWRGARGRGAKQWIFGGGTSKKKKVYDPIHVKAKDQPIMNKGIQIFQYGWAAIETFSKNLFKAMRKRIKTK